MNSPRVNLRETQRPGCSKKRIRPTRAGVLQFVSEMFEAEGHEACNFGC